ncbi:TadE/TadG family type IV pilus assembly protein [Microvirga roseola]|uniref:TadE/TadG family type IV pilus assembly protein n=1 Tax=Microvirga roseola TaxID=2883126 RepID=UPI001E60047F|nr:pilus assembly protein TadG-related protein [Microvirga roseola]
MSAKRALVFLRPAFERVALAIQHRVRAFVHETRGNLTIATALALPALIGATGLGIEVAHWYRTLRAMQNAADSAAVAAATNGGATSAAEALAVAASYGFVNGADNTSITVSDDALCPSAGVGCYSVTITRSVPLMLSNLVGFGGNVTVQVVKDGQTSTTQQTSLKATAIAMRVPTPRTYCVLALGNDGAKFEDITINGGSKSNLTNCGIMSNNDLTCNGSNQIADYADSSSGDPSGCGRAPDRGPVPRMGDPYSHLASNIPSNHCGGYPGEEWSAPPSLPPDGVYLVCGDLELLSSVTIGPRPGGTVIVIYNGQLNTGNFKLTGIEVTIVFAGTNDPAYSHIITGTNKGGLDITAPISGPWKGVAIYQSPDLTSGVDISSAGSGPTWNLTGLVYLPHSSVTFSGAVNKSSNGNSCFALVVDNMIVNGTGNIMSNGSDCSDAGLDLPSYRRGRLVG